MFEETSGNEIAKRKANVFEKPGFRDELVWTTDQISPG